MRGRDSETILRGQIYWLAPEGHTGSVPPIRHPHVVVQDDVFNRARIPTVIVCALTTNLGRAHEAGNVLLEPGEGGLEKQSAVIVSQLSVVEKAGLREYIGCLSPERVEQILAGLRFQQRSFFAPYS